MGQLNAGILSGITGKVGTIIGGSWRGKEYIRVKPRRKKSFVASPKQLDQYAKFALATGFVRSFAGLLRFSFREQEVVKTGRNCCVSHVLKHAITGTSPLFAIDYSKVLISGGSLKTAKAPTAVSTATGKVTFSWTNNADGNGFSSATDRAIVLVHCPELNETEYSSTGATRSSGTQVFDVSEFSGKKVHTYLGFIAEDGERVADSVYTGELTVA